MSTVIRVGSFAINVDHVVYTEKVPAPVSITLHLISGGPIQFTDNDAIALIQFFEDQAQINI